MSGAPPVADPAIRNAIVSLSREHRIVTPYTSFLVLESEQMWKDHQLKREVQKQDQLLGKTDKAKETPEESFGDTIRKLPG